MGKASVHWPYKVTVLGRLSVCCQSNNLVLVKGKTQRLVERSTQYFMNKTKVQRASTSILGNYLFNLGFFIYSFATTIKKERASRIDESQQRLKAFSSFSSLRRNCHRKVGQRRFSERKENRSGLRRIAGKRFVRRKENPTGRVLL